MRCPDSEGPSGRGGARHLRRRGLLGREEPLLRAHARGGHRGGALHARALPPVHQQGQLPQPPQDYRHRRACGLHRRHEHCPALCEGEGKGRTGLARHDGAHRGGRCQRTAACLPHRLVLRRPHPALRPQILHQARPAEGATACYRPSPAAPWPPIPKSCRATCAPFSRPRTTSTSRRPTSCPPTRCSSP